MVVKAILVIVGLSDLLPAVALLLTPRWFFDNVAPFPPYSQHFLGDAGAFLLPIGAGLLWAARNPARNAALILIGASASVLHAINHLYSSLTAGDAWPQTGALAVVAIAMVWISIQSSLARGRSRAAC